MPAPLVVTSDDDAQRMAIARALFEEGLRFVDQSAWQEAADRFSRVLAIRYSAVAAYNYGLAQARLGKLVTAAETLRKVLADSSLEAKVRDPVLALQEEINRKLGNLTLHVELDAQSCTVSVDGREWPSAAWDTAVPIDPGTHTIQLWHGGVMLRSVEAEIGEGKRVEKRLTLQRAPTPTVVASSAPENGTQPERAPDAALQADDTRASSKSLLRNPWFWVGVGAVVIAGATTAIVIAASGDPELARPVTGDFMPGVIEGRVP